VIGLRAASGREQFAVLLSVAGRPVGLIEVAAGDLYIVQALPDGIVNESRTFPDGRMSADARRADVGDYWIGVPEFGEWGTLMLG
jgi:hypothetical protein